MADAKDKLQEKKKLRLTITTPRGVKFVEEADMVVMRTIDGDLGVLPGHEALSTVMGDGVLRIKNNGYEKRLAVFGGTAEINNTEISILSTIAQRPDEIDLARAEEDRREAELAMQEEKEEHLTRRLQIMQMRALVRLHVGRDGYIDEDSDNGNGNGN